MKGEKAMSNVNTHKKLVLTAMRIAEQYRDTIASKYDEKRYNEMVRYIRNEYNKLTGESEVVFDDGILGRVIELYCRDSASTLTRVRTQGKIDAYIPTTSGKRIKAEIKTNGGQVQELLKMSKKQQETTAIIYFSHTKVPTAKNSDKPTSYYDCFKVMLVSEFLANVQLKKADSRGNVHVQPTSKKMYERFAQFDDFNRNEPINF
jgi:hypothetical protein